MKTVLPSLLILALLSGCSPDRPTSFQGYVEGDYLYLAAPVGGYLASPEVRRGDRVAGGATIAQLEPGPDSAAVAESEARGQAAADQLDNLKAPRRDTEIAAQQARLASARASLRLAESRLQRQRTLARQGFLSATGLDALQADRDQAAAQVRSLEQELANYRASLGRAGEVRGAEAESRAAAAALAQKRWQLEHRVLSAPAPGEINEVYYRPGEWVPAGQPVASLLPDGRRKLRFFVPEPMLAKLRPGQEVEARCDGCAAPLRARIDFIAPDAEYTPPVIYSQGAREKLLFRVEARPTPEEATRLRPGLPVDVTLGGAGAHD